MKIVKGFSFVIITDIIVSLLRGIKKLNIIRNTLKHKVLTLVFVNIFLNLN